VGAGISKNTMEFKTKFKAREDTFYIQFPATGVKSLTARYCYKGGKIYLSFM